MKYLFGIFLLITQFVIAQEDRSSWSLEDHISHLHTNKDQIIEPVGDNLNIYRLGEFAEISVNLSITGALEELDNDDVWDGALGVDVGIGEPDKIARFVTSIVATSIGLLKDGKFADRGFINFAIIRDIVDKTSIELFFNQAMSWGAHANERKGYSFHLSRTFMLPATKRMPKGMPLKVSAGAGTGGGFESFGSLQRGDEDNSFHPAGGLDLQFKKNASCNIAWTGRQLNSAMMLAPFKEHPIHVRLSLNDITKNSSTKNILIGFDLYYTFTY